MTAIVRNSVLNPLATCFVPSSLKTFNGDKTTVEIKSVPKESNMDENSNDQRTVERFNRPITGMDLVHIRKKLFGKKSGEKKLKKKFHESTMFFGFPSVTPENIPKAIRIKQTMYAMAAFGISNLVLLAVLKLLYNQGFNRNNFCRKPSKTTEVVEPIKDEKCCCPPMFGWVLPSTFFGNPFNLNYKCYKNYVHSSRYLEDDQVKIVDIQSLKQIDKWELSNISQDKETLNQCSLEFQMIVRDVCNSVRDDDTLTEGQEYIKVSERKDELNDRKGSTWNTPENKTSDEESLVDDGTHPLLESLPSGNFINEDEKTRESIRAVEKILEKCLPGKVSHPDKEVLTTAICNPPCSVWCEFLPSGAKDSFLRFLSKTQQNMNNTEVIVGQKPSGGKPVYKRSFSTDDAPKYANLCQSLSSLTTEKECRERLMLLRKGPVSHFGLDKRGYRSSHPDLVHRQLKTCLTTEDDSSMWGPFDGADSLWQPLPDCVPTSDCNQKHCNRKGREIRRQKSTN